jgi:DNA replicative helicase MCM subunit Mcm2 (Cdc46/Mcm family)
MEEKEEKQQSNNTEAPEKPIRAFQSLDITSIIQIKRGKTTFNIPVRELFKINAVSFECKRCGHTWLPQKKGKKKKELIPRTCPNCYTNYWFISKKDLKDLNPSYSIGKTPSKKPVSNTIDTGKLRGVEKIEKLQEERKPNEEKNKDERRFNAKW